MTNTSLLTVTAQAQITPREGEFPTEIIFCDLPGFRSDQPHGNFATFTPEFNKGLAREVRHLHPGLYDVNLGIFVDEVTGTDGLYSLVYCGQMMLDQGCSVTALSFDDQPYMMNGSGDVIAISSEHAASWLNDARDLAAAIARHPENDLTLDQAFNSARTGVEF